MELNQPAASILLPVVLVDSGDWTMGTLYDLTLGSEPLALGFLKRMRYDCVTLGNHERSRRRLMGTLGGLLAAP